MVSNQALLFGVFTINGIIIGILFDFFRIIRKSFKITDIGTYIQDILFWLISGFIFLYSMCVFCNGELRWFMVFGVLIGACIYIITISKYVISFSVGFINITKNIFLKILNIVFFPFKILYRVTKNTIIRPLISIFTKLTIKMKKIVKKMKQKRGILRKKENNII